MAARLRPFRREDAAALLAFCDQHPYGSWAASLRARLLTSLPSGPECVFDVYEDDARVLVAVAVDTLASPPDVVQLDVLGCRSAQPSVAAVEAILRAATAVARAARRPRLQSGWMHPLPAELQIALERHGQRLSEVDYRLRRPAATGRELPPLPPELEFRDVDERIEVAFRELIVRAFAEGDVPLLVPTAAEWRRSLLAATPPARALFQRGELLGGVSLRHEPGATIGEISTLARDPTARGRGVGELLVAEGCRVLASRGALTVELGVCSDNLPALDLYRRCGFELARESHTYAGHAADAA